MNSTARGLRLAALAVLTIALSTRAWAGGHGAPDGDARDLGAQWWQWALSIPPAVNPVVDQAGSQCMVGQSGPVWFLAGTFNGGTVSRRCQVPEGVSLFLPVVNSMWFDTPGVCGQGESLSVAELRRSAAVFVDSITRRTVTLDSWPLHSARRQSRVFALALPVDNIFNAPGCVVPGVVYPRSVDDGYYVRIDDLRPGEHILQLTATDGAGFDLNVTYRLSVVPRDRR